MTYLEICKSVRILAGAQGSGPTSVEDGDLGGYEVNLVHFVDTAYIDIQSSRDNFKFMRDDAQWGLVISQDVYDTAFIPDDIKKVDNIRIRKSNGKWKYLIELDYDSAEFTFINEDTDGEPNYFSRVPGSGNIKLYPPPSEALLVNIEYYRKPETLELNEDIPKLPEEFHLAIVYKAADRFAAFLGSPEIDEEYREAYKNMFRALCKNEVPSRDARPKTGRRLRGFDI